jgi:fatty acid desaturase
LSLGLFWQQLAFIGHDAGHNGITHTQFWDMFIGLFVGNIFGGVSIAWWKRSHNVHHVVCNSIEHDPDIQHLPFLAIAKEIYMKPFWSTYHAKKVFLDWAAKFFISYQVIYLIDDFYVCGTGR